MMPRYVGTSAYECSPLQIFALTIEISHRKHFPHMNEPNLMPAKLRVCPRAVQILLASLESQVM